MIKTEVLLTDAEYALDRAFGDYGNELTALIGIGKAMIAIGQELKRMNDRTDQPAENVMMDEYRKIKETTFQARASNKEHTFLLICMWTLMRM